MEGSLGGQGFQGGCCGGSVRPTCWLARAMSMMRLTYMCGIWGKKVVGGLFVHGGALCVVVVQGVVVGGEVIQGVVVGGVVGHKDVVEGNVIESA